MKPLKIILIIALLLTVTISVSAVDILFFYNGNEYLQLSVNDKFDFVAGLSDMNHVLVEYYDPERYLKMFEAIKNMNLSQIVKIFDKYLEENPEELHMSAAVSFSCAIDEIIDKE